MSRRWLLQGGIAGLFVAGNAWFFIRHPQSAVEVLVWTSGEKQNVLRPALDVFNKRGRTVRVDGRLVGVHARSVTVNSGEMREHLVRKLNENREFPSVTGGAPIVVSPSTSDWLAQVNVEVGRSVFDLPAAKPIVRTPVVVFTFREMAEALGWPARAIGWADIISLAESPDGWAAYPRARSQWGKKPLVAFTDPSISSTARSTLQLLHVAGAGKLAEQLTADDVQSPPVREFVRRFQATVDHYFPETLKLQTKIFQGPHFVHFAPVEEYILPWLYQGRVNAESAPGGKEQQRPITDLGYEVVALYPKDGTVWHDNPFAIPDAPWVTSEQRAAAAVVAEYLWSDEVQRQFVQWGFRPGTGLSYTDVLTSRLGIDPEQPKVLVGQVRPEVARSIQLAWSDVKKPGVAVLVMDISGSMAGARLTEAKEGAKRFIDSASPDTHVGLISFSSSVSVVEPIAPLPRARFALAESVERQVSSGQTALYEALKTAVSLVDGYEGIVGEVIRGVVLLTDGEANAGTTELSQVIRVQDRQEREVRVGVTGGAALKDRVGAGYALQVRHPVHVFSVGIGEADWEGLRVIAEATGGVVVRAGGAGTASLSQVLERFSKYF